MKRHLIIARFTFPSHARPSSVMREVPTACEGCFQLIRPLILLRGRRSTRASRHGEAGRCPVLALPAAPLSSMCVLRLCFSAAVLLTGALVSTPVMGSEAVVGGNAAMCSFRPD